MKFKYLKFPLPHRSVIFGDVVLRSIIPLEISHGGNALQYAALIDSGADMCIFHAEIAEYLSIELDAGKLEEFSGIQDGGGIVFIHKVILGFGNLKYKTSVGFSYDIEKHGFGILGQRGFFDRFVVKFDLIKEEIEIKTVAGKI